MIAVQAGTVAAHDPKVAQRLASERARRYAPVQRFSSSADAFAQIARDFPDNVVKAN